MQEDPTHQVIAMTGRETMDNRTIPEDKTPKVMAEAEGAIVDNKMIQEGQTPQSMAEEEGGIMGIKTIEGVPDLQITQASCFSFVFEIEKASFLFWRLESLFK